MSEPLMLSVPAAADALGCSPSTLYALIRDGRFPIPGAIRLIGGRIKISRVQLERWAAGEQGADALPTGAPTTPTPYAVGAPNHP